MKTDHSAAPKVAPKRRAEVVLTPAPRCSRHPRYQVKRRPIAKCDACWMLWDAKALAEGRPCAR